MTAVALPADRTDAGPEPRTARYVRFRLRDREYAIPLGAVSGLAESRPIREVAGSPAAVLGITEWRGRLFTVLDLPALLGDGPGDGPPCIVRLAEPFEATALLVPAAVRLERLANGHDPDAGLALDTPIRGTLDVDGVRVTLLEPRALVAELAGGEGGA